MYCHLKIKEIPNSNNEVKSNVVKYMLECDHAIN